VIFSDNKFEEKQIDPHNTTYDASYFNFFTEMYFACFSDNENINGESAGLSSC